MLQKCLLLPNYSIRVCLTGKIIDGGIGYGLEFPAEYMFYTNVKAIKWAKRTLDSFGRNRNVEKCFKTFKIKSF